MSLLPRALDERFFENRRRSSSAAGIVGGVFAVLLFAFRYFVQHRFSADLLAVALVIVGVKMALMLWFTLAR